MPHGAASTFAHIPDLLVCLGEQTRNKTTLFNLCLTSKFFNSLYTPFLYLEVFCTTWNADLIFETFNHFKNSPDIKVIPWHADPIFERFSDFKSNSNLDGVESFQYSASCFDMFSPNPGYISTTCMFYNKGTQALIKSMPKLHEFSWQQEPVHRNTIATLQKHCHELHNLKIIYPEGMESMLDSWKRKNVEWDPLPTPDLSHFKNLRRLEIHNIFGDLEEQRKGLVSALILSPGLHLLSLSIDMPIDELLDPKSFFQDLCEDFAERARKVNCAPLKLRKLVLGTGISLFRPNIWILAGPGLVKEPAEIAFYLSGLTDLESVIEVHIQNAYRNKWAMSELELNARSGIAWETLFEPFCPRLKRLSIFNVDKADFYYGNVRVLDSISIKEFIIEHHDDQELGDLDPVFEMFRDKLNKFREGKQIPGIEPEEAQDRGHINEDVEEIIEQRERRTPTNHISQLPNTLGIRQVFRTEHLGKYLAELKSCVSLEKLNIGLDIFNTWGHYNKRIGDDDNFSAIATTVANFKNLSHLCIRCIRPLRTYKPPPEIRKKVAQLLVSANSRLRYVKIGKQAWRVDRGKAKDQILQSLDKWEVKEIDIFDLGWPDEENFEWD